MYRSQQRPREELLAIIVFLLKKKTGLYRARKVDADPNNMGATVA
jgi:hypothetical protein